MEINFDKKGFLQAVVLLVSASVIIISWGTSARQIAEMISTSDFSPYTAPDYTYEEDAEIPFYASLPKEKPIFLKNEDLLKKKETLLWEKKDFLFADLEEMRLSLYQKGGLKREYPILAKAKEGGLFEIPTGFYKVLDKSESHLSRLEKIRLPWTIFLFGNYLINGQPDQLAGGRFRTDGGGVRLANLHAKSLFAEVKEETPVLVYNPAKVSGVELSYLRKTNLPHQVPEVSAAGALVADLETGQLLFDKNRSTAFPVASVSKLATAVVALENVPPEKTITVDWKAATVGGTMIGLTVGETFKSADLLKPMILASGNDAAMTYQENDYRFVELMNKKAKELGMLETSFQEATGLSENNIASAADLFKLLRYLYEKHLDFLQVTQQKDFTLVPLNKKIKHTGVNINWPRDDQRFLGGKAGWTNDALQTMAGVYGVRLSEYGWRPIAIVTLGSRNRISDIREIIKYLENGFVYGSAKEKKSMVSEGANIYEVLKSL